MLSYEDLLVIFMTTHDPTTLNKQGGDKGTQYRSVIYYHNEKQQKIARSVLKKIQSHYDDAIVTTLNPLPIFYEAEASHQNYYRENKQQRYCSMVINPKLAKFRKLQADKLK